MRQRKGEDVICSLIQQAIDDARSHIDSASMMISNGSVEESIQRIERAIGAYREAETELVIQWDAMGARRRNGINTDLDDVCRKIWIGVANISRMAKSNAIVYNQLRGLRRSFLIPGGVPGGRARAYGA
jgi:hypothetical protein